MTLPAILASVCIGTLIVGDRLEHLGITATWSTVAPRALQASSWLRIVCVACGWATIVALLLTR